MSDKKRAVGYVRVSSKQQAASGESLTTQRKAVKDFVKSQGWKLGNLYADEGISGGSVKGRPGLVSLLEDAQKKKFDVLVIHRLSRFGRNARDLLNNYEQLKEAGVELRSIKEQMDFSSPYGRAMLTMLSAVAELEREIIGENTLENRVALTKKNIPASGRLPYGRTYKNGKWGIDEEVQKKIKWAARQYAIKGQSIEKIAKKISMSESGLLRILKTRCGDTWTVSFKGEEYPMSVPALLDENMIASVHKRAASNKTATHGHIKNKYLLSRKIFCGECGYALTGHTDTQRKENRYYRHPKKGEHQCKDFSGFVIADDIEKAVLVHLFRTYGDVNNMEKAIARAIPNRDEIEDYRTEKENYEKELKSLEVERERLIKCVRKGTLTGRDIEKELTDIQERKDFLNIELDRVNLKVENSPTLEEVKEDAEYIRRMIEARSYVFSRLGEMTFDDKRVIVEKAFGAVKVDGKRLGVYIKKDSNGEIRYEINGGLLKYIDESCPKPFLKLPMPVHVVQDLLQIDNEYGEDYDPFVKKEAKPKRKLNGKTGKNNGVKQKILCSDI